MKGLKATEKIGLNLPRPMPAGGDCLPHAAMLLGSVRGMGAGSASPLVYRIVIEKQMSGWVLYRMDDGGGFVGDTWHADLQDAIKQVKKEFGVDVAAIP